MERASDASRDVEADVALLRLIPSAPSILRLLRSITGIELQIIARVTEGRWTACAVLNEGSIPFAAGDSLDIDTTICKEVRRGRTPVAVDDARDDPSFREHAFFRHHPFGSYIAEPIVLSSGECFGTLCAMGEHPAHVSDERTLALFRHFAQQLAVEIDAQRRSEALDVALGSERKGGALREQFIAVLAHDLRNPMSSIASAGQLLELKSDDARLTAQLARRIVANTRRMADMVNDLLDLSRGRLGDGMLVASDPIEGLAGALEEVLDELRGANPERVIRSRIELERAVCGDRPRLQQLLSNLVANALTHGGRDARVEVEAMATAHDGELVIRVRNDGPPIPAESIPGLFDAYSRRADSRPDREAGLGLGLYICQQIALAHDGELTVDSTREGGTVFTARLPAG